jgi:hypothetical protein
MWGACTEALYIHTCTAVGRELTYNTGCMRLRSAVFPYLQLEYNLNYVVNHYRHRRARRALQVPYTPYICVFVVRSSVGSYTLTCKQGFTCNV